LILAESQTYKLPIPLFMLMMEQDVKYPTNYVSIWVMTPLKGGWPLFSYQLCKILAEQ
jgi:hypothetical protein